EVGLRVLNGTENLFSSTNTWDWRGQGIYFWEQNPGRALEDATESSQRKQFNKKPVDVPCVLAAIIDLGTCLNLVEKESLKILSESYKVLEDTIKQAGEKMPSNKGDNRALDCAVIQFIHESNKMQGGVKYDTVRCAFSEGEKTYP